jgi:hypothetical protein
MSPAVEVSALVNGAASCRTCGWEGTRSDVLSYEFEPGQNSPEEQGLKFMLGIRDLFSTIAGPFGQLYIKYGFLDVAQPPAELKVNVVRYLGSAAIAIARSAVETREQLERERVNKSRKNMAQA